MHSRKSATSVFGSHPSPNLEGRKCVYLLHQSSNFQHTHRQKKKKENEIWHIDAYSAYSSALTVPVFDAKTSGTTYFRTSESDKLSATFQCCKPSTEVSESLPESPPTVGYALKDLDGLYCWHVKDSATMRQVLTSCPKQRSASWIRPHVPCNDYKMQYTSV